MWRKPSWRNMLATRRHHSPCQTLAAWLAPSRMSACESVLPPAQISRRKPAVMARRRSAVAGVRRQGILMTGLSWGISRATSPLARSSGGEEGLELLALGGGRIAGREPEGLAGERERHGGGRERAVQTFAVQRGEGERG